MERESSDPHIDERGFTIHPDRAEIPDKSSQVMSIGDIILPPALFIGAVVYSALALSRPNFLTDLENFFRSTWAIK